MEQRCHWLFDYSRPSSCLDRRERERQIAKNRDRSSASGASKRERDILGYRHALSIGHESPMTSGRRLLRSRERGGFTIIELIVALVVGLIVLGSVVQMMIVQGRGYGKAREQVDVRETAREGAALLSCVLRQAAV